MSGLIRAPIRQVCFAFAFCCLAMQGYSQSREGDCGFDRWSVKTMRDPDARFVRLSPVQSTVAKLASIPIPEIAYPPNGRFAPEEFTAYRVRGIVDPFSLKTTGLAYCLERARTAFSGNDCGSSGSAVRYQSGDRLKRDECCTRFPDGGLLNSKESAHSYATKRRIERIRTSSGTCRTPNSEWKLERH